MKARDLDGGQAEREKRMAIIVHKDNNVQHKTQKRDARARKLSEKQAHLNSVKFIRSEDDVNPKMLRVELEDQLEKYRSLIPGIPLKSHLTKNAARVECLKDAIRRYKENPDERLSSWSEEEDDIEEDEEDEEL